MSPSSVVSLSAPTVKNNTDNLATSSTVEELVACIPRPFQAFYKVDLKLWFDLGVKISHCQHAIGQLKNFETAGTFPPSILGAIKVPTVQVCKEFAESSTWPAWGQDLSQNIAVVRGQVLTQCIAVKISEVSFLQSLTSEEQSAQANKLSVEKASKVFASTFSSTSEVSSLYQKEVQACNSLGHTWFRRALSLGLAKHQRELLSKMAKLSIRKDTDTHMKEYGVNDIESIVKRAVAQALGKPSQKKGAKPKPTKKSSKSSPPKSKSTSPPSTEAGLDTDTNRGTKNQIQSAEARELAKPRKRRWEWEEEAEEVMAQIDGQALRAKRFKPFDSSSFPPKWFKASVDIRAQWQLLRSTPDFVNSISSTQSEVFQGENVVLPSEIRQILSLNGKFVLHDKLRPVLVGKAFKQLARSVRNIDMFKDRPENRSYIPKFYIIQEDWEPPVASENLERGLAKIKKYLYSQVNLLPKLQPRRNPSSQDLKRYLIEKKYLVKITDKNLGLSVISLEWYQAQCLLHLSNSFAYKEEDIHISSLFRELNEIATSRYLPSTIRSYIQASTSTLPRFYVIPKVHKIPWSSRPIVPSHSWITSKVAEVVDYALQPFISRYPSILSSSKEVIEKLPKIESLANCWIVTGDVVSMYTNIQPEAAVEAIRSIYGRESKGIRKSDLVRMIQFVLYNNFFRYGKKTYWQTSGLAMGVACAPVIANLVCAVYEKERLKYRSNVKFYGRYIDDILVFFQGTESELQHWIKSWRLPGLEIKWEYSRTKAVFLDIELLLQDERLTTRVYNKMLNKHMYIPFSSAHPLSVKRAFVKAERTRYKLLCSHDSDRKACESKLYCNLLRRGYPSKLLGEWFRDELKPVDRPIPKLVLKSQYNPIWEYIRIGPVREILRESQDRDLGLDTLVLSLQRGRCLYDRFNLYNLTLLDALELEDERVPDEAQAESTTLVL